jgi:hypothetical protein
MFACKSLGLFDITLRLSKAIGERCAGPSTLDVEVGKIQYGWIASMLEQLLGGVEDSKGALRRPTLLMHHSEEDELARKHGCFLTGQNL